MAISKKILLNNGIETNYHVIGMIESNAQNNETTLFIHSFISKEIYKEAIKKSSLLEEQKELVKQFDELTEIENPTKTQQTKINRLQNKINNLANEIDKAKDYGNFIAEEYMVDVSYQEDLSIKNLQNVLIEEFVLLKNATIVA